MTYKFPTWANIEDAITAGGGGGAPTSASYVTLGTNATLTSERVLTAGTGITLTDAGAGSTLTVAVTPGTYAAASHNHAASDITSGTLATARLGSGSATSTTYLHGDQTWGGLAAADLTGTIDFARLPILRASNATFSLTSSTAMTSAASISGLAVGVYDVSILVAYVSHTSAGIKIQVEATNGTSSWWVSDRDSGALAAWSSASTPNYSSSTGNTLRATIRGVLRVTSSTGTIVLKLAQNASNATATTAECIVVLTPY